MRLRIITPLTCVVDVSDIASVRAEDESGSFGILPGHADLLTDLAVSVVSWRTRSGVPGFCAVRRGVFNVKEGSAVEIASREAVLGESLEQLETNVLARFRAELDAERVARVDSARLHMAAVREIVRRLRGPARAGLLP